ncbi:MAG: TRAP transporter small permease [Spirochaetales bacterium]|jgi:TRAP-type C4-dicarboxylate transport system permease small subunit|nr:TRAP transporter small permease [Spirochaetales bacterium]
MAIAKRVEQFWKIIDGFFFWLASLTLGGMTVLIFIQVIFRYAFNSPLAWTEELARFLFIWMTFVAGVVAARRGQHIGVELIVNMLPSVGKKAIGIFAYLVSTVFFGIVSYYCISLWDKLSAQLSPALSIPMSFVYLGIILGSVFMGLYYFWSAIALCLSGEKGGNAK